MTANELKTYKDYLHQIGLSSGHNGRNQVTMGNHVNTYAEWLKKRGLDIQTATKTSWIM